MADLNNSLLQSINDTSTISANIKQHIKHGHHVSKYRFADDPVSQTDVIDPDDSIYSGIDFIKYLHEYLEKMNLGRVEFSVFQVQPRSKLPAFIANIKLGNINLASSFPDKYSLPEVAKQVAARKALIVLKKKYETDDVPITSNMEVVVERLEKELQKMKNYAGLFCDKVEDIYKEEYKETLPSDWLVYLSKFTTNIIVEELPNQNKSILYYASLGDKKKYEELMNTSMVEDSNVPLLKFDDKTEKTVTVTCIDSDHTFWIRFENDNRNNDFTALFTLMNSPDEYKHFNKMYDLEVFDFYAVQIKNEWYRFLVTKIDNDDVTGIFIDMGKEWCVTASSVMYLPPKFLKAPSQAIKCALSSLFFAPYFQVANDLFAKLLLDKQFTVAPDIIDSDVALVTLYNGKRNMNTMIMEAITEKTSFKQIDETHKTVNLSYVADGYLYLHPQTETLLILESILDSISSSRPLDQLYSKTSISPHKVYLVQCTDLGMWSRAKIEDVLFSDHKFKVYFIDYGNYGLIDEDKLIDLQQVDLLLAKINPQALKVSFHLFPPEKLTESRSRALYEMINDKALDIEVMSIDENGIQIVDVYDADERNGNSISFNTQLYQSV